MLLILRKIKNKAGDTLFITYGCRNAKAAQFFRDRRHSTDIYLAIAEYDAPEDITFDIHGIAKLKKFKRSRVPHTCNKFYVDLDVRPDKQNAYQSLQEIIDALKAAIKQGLPTPTYLHFTGQGVHLFWVIEENLKPGPWEAIGAAIRRKAIATGLNRDASPGSKTTAIARMLGSIHGTTGTKVTRKVLRKKLYSADELASALELDEYKDALPQSTGKTMFDIDYPPVEYKRVINACPAMQHFKTNPDECGYNALFAMLTIAARTTNPCRMSHYLAAHNKAKYSPDFINEKMSEAKDTGGPASCDKFAESLPDVCHQCPHWHGHADTQNPLIIADRREASYKNAKQTEAFIRKATQHVSLTVPVTNGLTEHVLQSAGYEPGATDMTTRYVDSVEGVKLLSGYVYDTVDHMLCHKRRTTDDDGKVVEETVQIVQHPVIPVAATHESDITTGSKLPTWCVRWAVQSHSFVLETRDILRLTTANRIDDKLREVMSFLPSKDASIKFACVDFYSQWVTSRGYQHMHSRLGFTNAKCSEFVTPLSVITSQKATVAAFNQDIVNFLEKFAGRDGTLDGWREAVIRYFESVGAAPQKAQLLMAFVSPLLAFVAEETSAFVMNVYGKSGTGKSFGLRLANSVWGKAVDSHISANSTANYIPAVAGLMNHLPLTIDEATLLPDSFRKDFAYTMTSGTERGRLEKRTNGSYVPNTNGARWRNSIMTTSNDSAINFFTHGSASQELALAETARLMELRTGEPVDEATAVLEASLLSDSMRSNYGLAGEAFISYLMKECDRDELRREYDENKAHFAPKLANMNVAVSSRFAVSQLALSRLATRILHSAGILPSSVFDGLELIAIQRAEANAVEAKHETSIVELIAELVEENTAIIQHHNYGTSHPRAPEDGIQSAGWITNYADGSRRLHIRSKLVTARCGLRASQAADAINAAGIGVTTGEAYGVAVAKNPFTDIATRVFIMDADAFALIPQ